MSATTTPKTAAHVEQPGHRAMRQSLAHRELFMLLETMSATAEMAERFLERHPGDCGCAFCEYDDRPDNFSFLKDDVRGMIWPLSMALSVLTSNISYPEEREWERLGLPDRLRRLADLSDSIDAEDDPAPAVADRPQVVAAD